MGEVKELKFVKDVVVKTADEELAAAGMNMKYLVGTMIEIPRAALTADQIATEAEFFSFGTNDLTQMTFGFSRDDAGKFLPAYYDNKIYESDPFARLDQVGVGKLVDMACKLGRATRPELHLGICGEHGGDPSSVEFCHQVGLDYVSRFKSFSDRVLGIQIDEIPTVESILMRQNFSVVFYAAILFILTNLGSTWSRTSRRAR